MLAHFRYSLVSFRHSFALFWQSCFVVFQWLVILRDTKVAAQDLFDGIVMDPVLTPFAKKAKAAPQDDKPHNLRISR